MKHLFLLLAIVSLVGVPALRAAGGRQSSQRTPSSAPATQTAKPAPAKAQRPAVGKTHVVNVNAEFVSYDAKAKTITIKDEKGQMSTARVEGKATGEVAQLHLKNGDHVMLTCRDNAKGEHQTVTGIKLAKGKA